MIMDPINKEIHDARHLIQMECDNDIFKISQMANAYAAKWGKTVHLTPQTPFAKTA